MGTKLYSQGRASQTATLPPGPTQFESPRVSRSPDFLERNGPWGDRASSHQGYARLVDAGSMKSLENRFGHRNHRDRYISWGSASLASRNSAPRSSNAQTSRAPPGASEERVRLHLTHRAPPSSTPVGSSPLALLDDHGPTRR